MRFCQKRNILHVTWLQKVQTDDTNTYRYLGHWKSWYIQNAAFHHIFTDIFKQISWMNNSLHTSHKYGHKLLYMHSCLFEGCCWWNSNYIHHRYMKAGQLIYTDVPSEYHAKWITQEMHKHVTNAHQLCMRWCFFKLPCWLNDLLHTPQV